jgi:hypothetical protein
MAQHAAAMISGFHSARAEAARNSNPEFTHRETGGQSRNCMCVAYPDKCNPRLKCQGRAANNETYCINCRVSLYPFTFPSTPFSFIHHSGVKVRLTRASRSKLARKTEGRERSESAI